MLTGMKKLFAPVDMTEGSPGKRIVAFTIPMLIGNIAQQLYNTVDSIIVGRFVGDNALAAVGSAGPILNLLLVLFVGISVGVGIMVSQYFGAKQREELSKTIGCCITLTIITTILVMAITPFVTMPLLRLLNTPDTIIGWCNSYLMILFMGIIGCAFYNILGGILRGLGDSVSALLYLLVATVINIVLDYIFVAKFGLGVAGVALATVIAQMVSAVLSFLKLCRMKDVFDMRKKYLVPEKKYMWDLIRLGLPSGVTQAIFSLSMIVVQSLTNSFGEMFIAANVIVMRVDGFAMMPAFSFGTAMTTYAGQNVGARKMDRVIKGAKQGTGIAVATSTVITILILLFGKYLMAIFTSTPELVDLSFTMMKILAVGYIAMEVTQCLSGVMRGAGDTVTPMWISMVTTVVIRVPLAYGLAYLTRSPKNPNGNSACIFISLLISWVLGAGITFLCYRAGRWKKKALD
ncbi:MAG: MATE family efflux transporter [Faecalicatena sp.]|uniref:MATE family efflux transporter n=1 Tax=Faecalicatena sp. TaxID=2005360 RepID=UPI002591092A|nr:MATE family efflux transporter [Faecalicatena sp.]MCI6464999.1 MATE family efflux transporter [Faecalicatena sp.]